MVMTDFGKPTLAKPTLANFSVFSVWAKFLNPKEPEPPRPRDQHSDLNPQTQGEGAPHPSGPLHALQAHLFWRCWCWCGCGFGLRRTTFRRTAQNFALFFPLPPPFSLFFCLSGCLLVEFWWCLKAGTLKCPRLEFSGCRVKPRRPQSSWGFTRLPENSKRAHWRVPGASNTTKIPREDTRERQKERKWGQEREKSAKIWAPPPSGPHPSGVCSSMLCFFILLFFL